LINPVDARNIVSFTLAVENKSLFSLRIHPFAALSQNVAIAIEKTSAQYAFLWSAVTSYSDTYNDWDASELYRQCQVRNIAGKKKNPAFNKQSLRNHDAENAKKGTLFTFQGPVAPAIAPRRAVCV
jgi:hypothetical protein